MRLNLGIVATLFRTELRMVLRDRRMVITSLVLPLLVTPLIFLVSTHTAKKREQELRHLTYRYAVVGHEAGLARALMQAAREQLESSSRTNQDRKGPFRFEEVSTPHPLAALNRGAVQFILQVVSATETNRNLAPEAQPLSGRVAGRANHSSSSQHQSDGGETALAGVPGIRIIFRADRDESSAGATRIQGLLRQVRTKERYRLLQQHGFPLEPDELSVETDHNLASKSQVAGLNLGRLLTLLLLLFILTSGAVIATDSLAGEKERGTLETLLTTSARRVEILAAKHLVILAVALMITCIQALNLLVYVRFKLLPLPPNLAAAVPPGVVVLLIVLFLPVAALVANVLLLISGYARSYKEAQMYFMPAFLIGLVPGVAPLMPGVTLRSALVLVPVANIALAAKEILTGSFDWPMIGLAWLVTAGVAVWTTRLGVRVLSTERLTTGAEIEAADLAGGPALFERHVARWFAILWAVLLLVSNYTEKLDLRLQITINLVGIFFLGTGLMLLRYRLNPRQVLAFRLPKPAVWLGVLCTAPGGLLTALGVFQVANWFLPVPEKMMKGFDQSVLPPGISLLQLAFFLGVMPGLFEEMAFRGLLLHGLRRRLRPVPLALIVGLTFGFFHVALFRLVPTAFLGIMLAAVTLLTGSIFPAMLWHCLNNTLGLLMARLQFPDDGLDLRCYLCGAALLAVGFWLFYRNRTPYPDLRGSR